ncbi:TPA: hypothetical protein SOK69_003593 [Clostridioides difficile]|nr:hypothetical protein [Clostridioides difficile]HEK4636437.1 hypothetical protein [Clostridioides difficile]HEK4742633.1 hypothetical protein [Clostridioides difficile]HEK5084547.1 hypothetical protein [Clostridioides difficile]HEK9030391.1 hypothetical protein [Clostridioides difficile]
MIKIEFENVEEVKEFVEVFRVVETSNNDIVCFGEVESIDSCTEENAKHALDIIKKHKHSDRKEKAYCEEISSAKTDTITCNCNNVSKDKETNESECFCFICSKKIENKEDVFKMPFLIRDYLGSTNVIKDIEVCEKCLDCNSWYVIKKGNLSK